MQTETDVVVELGVVVVELVVETGIVVVEPGMVVVEIGAANSIGAVSLQKSAPTVTVSPSADAPKAGREAMIRVSVQETTSTTCPFTATLIYASAPAGGASPKPEPVMVRVASPLSMASVIATQGLMQMTTGLLSAQTMPSCDLTAVRV